MTTLFRNSSPNALTRQQAVALEKKRMNQRREAAQQLADAGRGEDTEVAHVARGEIVLPRLLQNPEVMAAVVRAAKAHNIPLGRLLVGNARNSINPHTGVAEFGLDEPEAPTQGAVAQSVPAAALPKSPWRDIDREKLRNIIYNEMASFRGDPQQFSQAMWAMANVIMNRQAAGIQETYEGPKKTIASPIISDREMKAINDGYKPAVDAYNMAGQIADHITSAPEAFPSPWPYTHYNHRDTDSKAPHAEWKVPPSVQYGPFKTYQGETWMNIYDVPGNAGQRR